MGNAQKDQAIALVEQIKNIEISIFYTLLNKTTTTDIAEMLTEDDFYSESCKRYFKAVRHIIDTETETDINALTVADALKQLGIYEDGDIERLIRLQTETAIFASKKTVELLKKYVNQLKIYRKSIEIQQKALERIEFGEDIEIEEIIEYFTEETTNSETLFNKEFYENFYNPPKKKWLLNQLIYKGSVNVITGFGGVKKSYLALQMAITCILLKPFLLPEFLWNPDTGKVLFLSVENENPIEIILERVHAILNGLELSEREKEIVRNNLKIVLKPEELALQNNKGFQVTDFFRKIKRIVEKERIDLVIVDPVNRFAAIDENNNAAWTWFYNRLESVKTTWILINHPPKSDMSKENDDPLTARGASAKRENARTHISMRKDVLHIDKANFSKYNDCFITISDPYKSGGYFAATVSRPITREEFNTITPKKSKQRSNRNGKYEKAKD